MRKTAPLLEGLPEEELRQIADAGQVHVVAARAFLFKQGDPAELLHLVTHGSVLFYRVTGNGRRVLLDVARPGIVVGSGGVVHDAYFFTAEAQTESRTVAWDRKTTMRLVQSHPRLAVNALRLSVARNFEYAELLCQLVDSPAPQRLAATLVRLAERLGERDERGMTIAGLSEEEIGVMAGLNLSTTNRILRSWMRQGALQMRRRRILILRLGPLLKATKVASLVLPLCGTLSLQ